MQALRPSADGRTAGTEGGGLAYPYPTPPKPGEVIEVAPGILWARIPLPFRLNHINVYLIDDGDGWAVLDTGIGNDATRAIWEALAAGPLAGRRLTRLIVTHFHPDHIGLAGWLCERFGLPLLTSQTTLSRLPQHLAQPRRARRQALPRLLPAPRARRGDDAARRHPGPRLPEDGVGAAADVPAPGRGRHAEDRRAQLRGADRQRPRARAGHALLRRRQRVPRRRPGAGQDHAQHQRVGGRSGGRSARPLHALAARAEGADPGGRAGAARPPAAVPRPAHAQRRADRPPRGALRHDRRRLPRGAALGRRAGAGAVPPRARPAPDELRLQRGAGARELHAAPAASWRGRTAATASSASSRQLASRAGSRAQRSPLSPWSSPSAAQSCRSPAPRPACGTGTRTGRDTSASAC